MHLHQDSSGSCGCSGAAAAVLFSCGAPPIRGYDVREAGLVLVDLVSGVVPRALASEVGAIRD